MEENKNLEQPFCSDGAEAQTTENNVEENGALNNEGSNKFGKFASAEELFSAYKNLEAEFTKKSQKLAQLEKEKPADNTQSVPAYEKEDWFKTVQTFYEENPKAKGFEKEISQIILSDKQIACSKSPLDEAWQKIASEKFRTEDEIATDNEFLDKYVLNNPFVQESVLKTYLENLKQAPALISSSKGKQINIAMKEKPKNLEQARAQVENLFK